MKYQILLLFALLSFSIQAQNLKPKTKTIEVVGNATQEVVPDEIYVQITLKEYKKGNQKVSINSLEKKLVNAVEKLGLPANNLMVDNIYGYNWNWKKRKAEEFLATKSFKLLMNDVTKMNDLISMIDEKGVNSMNVNQYDHSQIEKLKADLKVKAIKAAREKANNLLSAIDEELGGALQVSEMDQGIVYPQRSFSKARSFESASMDNAVSSYNSEVGFKKIKLNVSIRVTFEIK